MSITDHGVWEPYTPEKHPANAPANTLFARRKRDGVDWYDYVNSGKYFGKGSIKATVIGGLVAAATYDETRLFPANAQVIEIAGVELADPQEVFGNKIYDAAKGTFSDPPPLPDLPDPMEDLRRRIEALERGAGG